MANALDFVLGAIWATKRGLKRWVVCSLPYHMSEAWKLRHVRGVVDRIDRDLARSRH